MLFFYSKFIAEQREHELAMIIKEEKLKDEETRKYIDNCFRNGEVKIVGTDIETIMPPVSRFGAGNRIVKKQNVIDKLKNFFDKYFGMGTIPQFSQKFKKKSVIYDYEEKETLLRVAENADLYGSKK